MALLVKIGADLRNFDRKMKRATKDISYLGGKIAGAGRFMTRGVTLPLIGIAVAAGKVGMDFETQMNRVAAISLATGEDLQALEDKARDLGSTTMFTSTQAAEGLENYARAGFEVKESLDAIEPSVNLAIATGVELATVTDIVASAIKGFGMDAKNTAKLTDLLANVTANSKTNLEQLGEAFNYVAPLASALGYTAEDTAEALGLMANAGITGSMAGTTLRTAMTNLAKPTAEAKRELKELGIELTDTEGNMLPLDDVIGQLRGSFKELTKEEQAQKAATIFGKRALSGMLAVINATEEDISKLADATTNYNGVVKKQADIMQSGSKGALMRLKSATEELGIAFSEVLLPALNKVVAKVQGLVDKLNSLSPKQKEQIVRIAGMVAAIGPLLLVVGKGVSLFGKLSGLFGMISGGAGIAGGALAGMALPIIGIIAGVAALIAIFVHLYKTNEVFRNKMNSIWSQIKEMFSGVVDFLKALFGVLILAWESNFMNIQGIVQSGWEYITEIFTFAIQLITDIFKVFTLLLQGDWQGALEAIKTLGLNFWNGLTKLFAKGINFVLNLFGTNLEKLVRSVTEKIDKIKQVFVDLKEKMKSVIDKIKAMWKSFKLPTFVLKIAVATFLGKTIRYPTGFRVVWHKDGGIFTRPTVLGGHGFGEAGKEAILPLNRLPGLLGLDNKESNIIQIFLDGEMIEQYVDNALGNRLLGGM
jgi:TP901 family phage tail tape measure protein